MLIFVAVVSILANFDLPFFYFLECSSGAKQQTDATSGYITMWRDVEPNVLVSLTCTVSHRQKMRDSGKDVLSS